MKRIALSLVAGIIIIMVNGCGESNHKVNSNGMTPKESVVDIAFKKYFTKDLGDPSSYTPVSTKKISSDGLAELYKHQYRARNKYNALELNNEYIYYNTIDKKVIISIPKKLYTGFMDFVMYGIEHYRRDFNNVFIKIGGQWGLKNGLNDRKMWIKLGTFYQYQEKDSYNQFAEMARNLPYGAYAENVLYLMRLSPELTADAIMDANNLK